MSFSLENLCFAYDGHRVIDDVTLAFDPGKSIGIIGPNGSGKSTLLDLMAGHLAPDSGTGRTRKIFYPWGLTTRSSGCLKTTGTRSRYNQSSGSPIMTGRKNFWRQNRT